MNLSEFSAILASHPEKRVRLRLPDGSFAADEFHVTEVGHVLRRFIDCGGTIRSLECVLLQSWVSENDSSHRLTAGKLSGILKKAGPVLPPRDLPVEFEHETIALVQYPVTGCDVGEFELLVSLGKKTAECLAVEICAPRPVVIGARVAEANTCCGPLGCR